MTSRLMCEMPIGFDCTVLAVGNGICAIQDGCSV